MLLGIGKGCYNISSHKLIFVAYSPTSPRILKLFPLNIGFVIPYKLPSYRSIWIQKISQIYSRGCFHDARK